MCTNSSNASRPARHLDADQELLYWRWAALSENILFTGSYKYRPDIPYVSTVCRSSLDPQPIKISVTEPRASNCPAALDNNTAGRCMQELAAPLLSGIRM